MLSLDPADWKIQDAADLFHQVNPGTVTVPSSDAFPLTPESTPPVPALDHDALAQFVLGLVNRDRAGGNAAPVGLGANTAAQAHADDMANYQYFSRWGTDGANSAMRYTLAGGTSYGTENDYAVKIAWGGGSAADFENAVRAALEQAESGLMKQISILVDPQGASTILYKWNKKVNLGISYDSEYVFLVEQFEAENIDFTQAPVIQNCILSFSGLTIPGFVIDTNLLVEYDRTPSGLTPSQLNNAPWDGAGRPVATISATKPYLGVTVTQGFQYTDPHSVPLDAPFPPLDSDARLVPIANLAQWSNITASTWNAGGATFSISADLSQIVSRFGAGVYTIVASARTAPNYVIGPDGTYTIITIPGADSPGGVTASEGRMMFRYCIFVE